MFGGETDGKPFMAVHDLKDSNFVLLGFKPQDIANMEDKVKIQKGKVSPEKFQELMAKCQKEISEMKTAYLCFPKLEKCIFNVQFFGNSPIYVIGSDFKSSVVICELGMGGILREISTISIHSDLIQSMILVDNEIFTCSADRTIVRTKINTRDAIEAAEKSRKLRFS